jgi:hypothetical protein
MVIARTVKVQPIMIQRFRATARQEARRAYGSPSAIASADGERLWADGSLRTGMCLKESSGV